MRIRLTPEVCHAGPPRATTKPAPARRWQHLMVRRASHMRPDARQRRNSRTRPPIAANPAASINGTE